MKLSKKLRESLERGMADVRAGRLVCMRCLRTKTKPPRSLQDKRAKKGVCIYCGGSFKVPRSEWGLDRNY